MKAQKTAAPAKPIKAIKAAKAAAPAKTMKQEEAEGDQTAMTPNDPEGPAKDCMGVCSDCAQHRCFLPKNHEGRERGKCLCTRCHYIPLGAYVCIRGAREHRRGMNNPSFNGAWWAP